MRLPRIVRMLLLGLGAWAVLAAVGAVIFGRALHHADRMETRVREPLVAQLDDPLRRSGAIRPRDTVAGALPLNHRKGRPCPPSS